MVVKDLKVLLVQLEEKERMVKLVPKVQVASKVKPVLLDLKVVLDLWVKRVQMEQLERRGQSD